MALMYRGYAMLLANDGINCRRIELEASVLAELSSYSSSIMMAVLLIWPKKKEPFLSCKALFAKEHCSIPFLNIGLPRCGGKLTAIILMLGSFFTTNNPYSTIQIVMETIILSILVLASI